MLNFPTDSAIASTDDESGKCNGKCWILLSGIALFTYYDANIPQWHCTPDPTYKHKNNAYMGAFIYIQYPIPQNPIPCLLWQIKRISDMHPQPPTPPRFR